ncbi:hypothetical protein TB2_002295 [Malus domestica]|uniref:RING-type E3 ubiquitin transferase n=1 Tax=Malus domestica TaxID=3750 RepID=A0A498IU97_MALDO|nr:hypothetical protein DVH24_009528 [Malus domestica]
MTRRPLLPTPGKEKTRILGLRGDEWKDLFVVRPDLEYYSIAFLRSLTEPQSVSIRRVGNLVPFVLVDSGGGKPSSDSVVVNVDGSTHPLPLTTVYQHLYPVIASPYSSLLALFGNQYPGGVLDQDKILPLRKEITAVGLCSLKNGVPEIESCKDLSYFL